MSQATRRHLRTGIRQRGHCRPASSTPRSSPRRNIQEVGEQLYSLVETEGHKQILLNFGNVQYLSSAALGKLIQMKKKVGVAKGKLMLCCIHPDLLEVFRITRLDQVFEIPRRENRPRSTSSERLRPARTKRRSHGRLSPRVDP